MHQNTARPHKEITALCQSGEGKHFPIPHLCGASGGDWRTAPKGGLVSLASSESLKMTSFITGSTV